MAKKKYVVDLTEAERTELKELIASGESKARKITRARILLKAEQDKVDEEIAEALETSVSTVERVRRRFVESGLSTSPNRRQPRRNYEGKLDGKAEAHLVALACRPPPVGHNRWTLRLLADKLVQLDEVELEAVSHETVRQVLKKTNLSPGKRNNG